MDEAGKYSHALYAALYAANKLGCDLDAIQQLAKDDIVGNNSLRPHPLHQEDVRKTLAEAIKAVKETL